MSELPVISASQLGKIYSDGRREVTVLNQLDLTVSAGEWLAIVGVSGAGKSTLLNLLGGLDVPSAGEVLVAGRSLSALSEDERSRWRNRQLGFVFQMHHLLPEFSALESVAMPARIGGANKRDAEEKAQRLLAILGMGERLGHRPAELSGGASLLKAVAAPIPELRFFPTGGINAALVTEYSKLPNVVSIGGSWFAPAELIAEKKFSQITKKAKEALSVFNN